jgi:hypothetical protein
MGRTRSCWLDFVSTWAGWKMRGNRLFPPHWKRGGPTIGPPTGPPFLRWLAEMESRHLDAEDLTPPPRRHLRLVSSR